MGYTSVASVFHGVTNLIHDRHSSQGKCGSMCPLKREQARRKRDSGLWDVYSL